jgi:uncharacterized membrane protein YeaQ/YmgE (transglycosylase-associated protein family)
MSFLLFLLIGLAAGWLAGQIMKGSGFGLWINLLLGVAGSFIGGFLFQFLGIGGDGILVSLVAAFVGAILLLFIIGKRRRSSKNPYCLIFHPAVLTRRTDGCFDLWPTTKHPAPTLRFIRSQLPEILCLVWRRYSAHDSVVRSLPRLSERLQHSISRLQPRLGTYRFHMRPTSETITKWLSGSLLSRIDKPRVAPNTEFRLVRRPLNKPLAAKKKPTRPTKPAAFQNCHSTR